jgi:hypothetical protein
MEMPKSCEACPMCGTASRGNGMYELWCMCGDFGTSSTKRPDNCPIICALPEGHGRLVDADDLLSNRYIMADRDTVGVKTHIRLSDIDDALTIVPAERSET